MSSQSAVSELEAGLLAMQALKPPGVSGSRIKDITALCVANVQSESVLIQKIFTHFKRTNGTHKLGVLYVVDSVTRKWMEQAKQRGQVVNNAADDGSFAAGVNRVTELMPLFMSNILASAPEDQKEKIRKLVDIWEKGSTFPATMIEGWKAKLNAPPSSQSTTPPGSPPPGALAAFVSNRTSNGAPPASSAPASVTNIMETLANIARQSASAAPSNPSITAPTASAGAVPAPAPAPFLSSSGPPLSSSTLPPALAALVQQQQQQQAPAGAAGAAPLPFFPPAAQPTPAPAPPVMPGLPFQLPSQFPGQVMPPTASPLAAVFSASSQAGNALGGFAAPANPAPAMDNMQQQVVLIQALLAQGMSPDVVTAVLQNMNANSSNNTPPAPFPAPSAQGNTGFGGYGSTGAGNSNADGWGAARSPVDPRDRDRDRDRERDRDMDGRARSPNSRQARGRSRSRSPGRHWDSRLSPRGGGGDGGRGRLDDRERDRGRGPRSEYRQRSPPGQGRRGSSPHRDGRDSGRPSERWIEFDRSLPDNSIRVLSRTLFVGGVTCPENELRNVFGRYGEVQSCIVNREKRHAFVKMYTRKDAAAAKEAMADTRNTEYHQLRTRWGVGFGPRDCSDYQIGISVVPINRLTEADRKWLLTAPYGGTGGKPITGGMVVEEPDIEIGAGVSSKAISRRMQTDRGGAHGPKSSHLEDDGGHGPQHHRGNSFGGGGGGRRRGGGRDGHRRGGGGGGGGPGDEDGPGQSGAGNGQISAPDFGFGLSVGPNGMPIFPPGFAFPDPAPAQ